MSQISPSVLAALAFSILLPVGLTIFWKVKTKAKIGWFLTGALCFLLFAYVLEALMHQFVLARDTELSRAIYASPVLYMLYASFAAGIFEETGRLFGYKVLLRKTYDKNAAVAYGIGHGGIEVILILGLTYAVYFLAQIGVPVGNKESTEMVKTVADSIRPPVVLMAMGERISAMLAHIGLSMVMFRATKEKGKLWLYPICICLHALLDMPAALYQMGYLTSLPIVEIGAFVMGAACFVLGIINLKKMPELGELEACHYASSARTSQN